MRRWDKQYSACYLDDLPHTRLTRPAKAFEYFFDGARKGRGRENILRLEVGHASTSTLHSFVSFLQRAQKTLNNPG